ncbi:MAG: hypothetical protein ACF8Q5_07510 [Phycisphaerales bacterium JB040]
MLKLSDGQCGLCAHFGEEHPDDARLVQVRIRGEAPEDLVEDCGHPQHAGLDLHVSAISGCAGFTPAKAG